jgi:hypothetical protein
MSKYGAEEQTESPLACLNAIAITIQGEGSVKEEIEIPT